MFKIPNTHLYLSNNTSARQYDKLKSLGIKKIIVVAKELKAHDSSNFSYLYLPVTKEGYFPIEDYFEKAIEFIDESKDPVLVHCDTGLSRSPSIVIAYLMKTKNLDSSDAYDIVSNVCNLQLHNGFRIQLNEYLDTEYEKSEK